MMMLMLGLDVGEPAMGVYQYRGSHCLVCLQVAYSLQLPVGTYLSIFGKYTVDW